MLFRNLRLEFFVIFYRQKSKRRCMRQRMLEISNLINYYRPSPLKF
jgi:hypothetical protein